MPALQSAFAAAAAPLPLRTFRIRSAHRSASQPSARFSLSSPRTAVPPPLRTVYPPCCALNAPRLRQAPSSSQSARTTAGSGPSAAWCASPPQRPYPLLPGVEHAPSRLCSPSFCRGCACPRAQGGSKLASGSKDSSIKIWDVATGTCEKALKGHAASVSCLALSADGKKLMSGERGPLSVSAHDPSRALAGPSSPFWCHCQRGALTTPAADLSPPALPRVRRPLDRRLGRRLGQG